MRRRTRRFLWAVAIAVIVVAIAALQWRAYGSVVVQQSFSTANALINDNLWWFSVYWLVSTGVSWLRITKEERRRLVKRIGAAFVCAGAGWLVVFLAHLFFVTPQGMYASATTQLPVPTGPIAVLAENPDHAIQLAGLNQIKRENEDLEQENNALTAELAAAQLRNAELERQIEKYTNQQAHCDIATKTLEIGNRVLNALVASDAAPQARQAVDQWYEVVCKVLSASQCQAFKSARRSPNSVVGYPLDDGGYYQTLSGRLEYLTSYVGGRCR